MRDVAKARDDVIASFMNIPEPFPLYAIHILDMQFTLAENVLTLKLKKNKKKMNKF